MSIHWDRSRNSTDLKCERRRFWNYDFQGRGLAPKRRALALEFGSVVHEGFAELLLGEDLESVVVRAVGKLNDQLAAEGIEEMVGETEHRHQEMRFLTEGLLRVSALCVVPKILEFYRPVRVEGEVTFDHDGCTLMSKPDAIVERLADGQLVYIELKTTSSMDERWQKQWFRAVQLPAGALGVAQTLGRPLAATIVVGLNKGYWNKKYARQESPLLYGYADGGALTAKYRPGLRKLAVWEAGMSSQQWLAALPYELLNEQVVTVGPVPYQDALTRAWLRQTAIREQQISGAKAQLFGGAPLREADARQILDTVWRQNFSECESGWGSACPYRDACFIPHVERDPLASGLFEWRAPHHESDPALDLEAA